MPYTIYIYIYIHNHLGGCTFDAEAQDGKGATPLKLQEGFAKNNN